jgi:hypothetical protein
MKLPIKLAALARMTAFIAIHVALPSNAFPQGSLTPPGAPAPTMKTLAQIEPRTPISSAPFTINQSGSYYLTNNLTVSSGDAVTIAVDNVTLDLNGFTITSTAPSASGIAIRINGGLKNLVIENGFILSGVTNTGGSYSGPGFGNGIIFVNTQPTNTRVTNVSVTGCRFHGVYLAGESTLVESCMVRTVGINGIWAGTIRASSARDCGGHGLIGEQVSDCRGESTGSSHGINGINVLNSFGTASSGDGVDAQSAQNCYGYSLTGTGITASTAVNSYGYGGGMGISTWTAQSCYGTGSSGTGLHAEISASNCYGISASGTGIFTSTAENCYGQASGDAPGVHALSAQNCRGYSGTGRGVFSETAENCYGVSASGVGGAGIFADLAQSCRGSSTSGVGISATTALNCTGYSATSFGIYSINAQNCYGYATAGGTGLSALKTAQNCFGSGAYGITVGYTAGGIATNCHGVSTGNGHGLQTDIAIGCYGQSPNGIGVLAIIANCCRGFGSPIGVSYNFKYNMP